MNRSGSCDGSCAVTVVAIVDNKPKKKYIGEFRKHRTIVMLRSI